MPHIWVVRLTDPHRVEVHTPDAPMRLSNITDMLEAPGVLRNPVPVRALFERTEAHRVTLTNLLQREGYESLEMVRQEGFAEGEFKGGINAILTVLKTRGLNIDTETEARIYACRDHEQLQAWLGKAALVEKSEDLILRAEKK